ncbi:hypothetical protein [Streptomyces flavofungini]|uniref:hypothetical protein n=1 Tax=Streptomyces flavofungini TaxID=68200 RepID=UPI0034DECDA0
MNTFKRRLAAVAAATCLTAGFGVTAAGTAQAAADDCGPLNIGKPGVLQMEQHHIGEVQQVYNTCDGTARAHFTWDEASRQAMLGFDVRVALYRHNGTPAASATAFARDGAVVDTPWAKIDRKETYQVSAQLVCMIAYGSYHSYADGAEWGDGRRATCM